jgi:hypothetical protein
MTVFTAPESDVLAGRENLLHFFQQLKQHL